MKAEIISTYPLSKDEIAGIVAKFQVLKKAEIVNTIDSGLKSGFIIKYEGKIIDLSLATRLNSLKNTLYETD